MIFDVSDIIMTVSDMVWDVSNIIFYVSDIILRVSDMIFDVSDIILGKKETFAPFSHKIKGEYERKKLVEVGLASIYKSKNMVQSFSFRKHSKAILHNVRSVIQEGYTHYLLIIKKPLNQCSSRAFPLYKKQYRYSNKSEDKYRSPLSQMMQTITPSVNSLLSSTAA